jgi:adenine/guanine/hypoxanthine permease
MGRVMLERFFRLAEHQTSARVEVLAGATTFLTMAYIIFVQPAVLSGKMFGFDTGMDFGAITTATCLSAAVATAIMAFYARYPIAQSPGMGENFFFVFSAIPAATAAGFANAWQVALGTVFVSGVLFLILSVVGLVLGRIAYPILKLLGGRGRDIGWLAYLLAVVLLAYFIFVRSKMG